MARHLPKDPGLRAEWIRWRDTVVAELGQRVYIAQLLENDALIREERHRAIIRRASDARQRAVSR